MSFRDIPLLRYYKTYKNNVVREFYTPVLKEAVLYQRAVGFFTSGALIDLTKGLKGLTKNKGKIQFIVSLPAPVNNRASVHANALPRNRATAHLPSS